MNGKQKIIFYRDWSDTFDRLTNEEAGELIKYFCAYISDKNPKEPSRLTGLLFEPIKQTLKRDLEKWKATCERNRKNGENGGRPKSINNQEDNGNPTKPNKTQNNPLGFLETQQNQKKPDIDIDRDNEYKESNLKITKEKSSRFSKPSIEEIKIYCTERKNTIDPEKFFDFYESNGWHVGKNKMRNWKASVRTWEKTEKEKNKNKLNSLTFDNENTEYDRF